ncbi:hypothetical protein [Streptomyces chiangmaiensis]|uniref:VCBS repeat-containing protein n=1 Tax=Streptomyces chiangmaiensis TaxID=766497 RepID=A0ABU7FRG1_9ACTN|nr:hypothetical protein [Streptomyces chiangmaiensis]MED7826706.1 hypothetical protein [Streptomyces chiangmaiensis]
MAAATTPTASEVANVDPTGPGAPAIYDASGYNCGDDASPVAYQVGVQASFTLASDASGESTASYLYQLNGTAPVSVASTGPSTPISITPTQGANVLTVTAVSAGGNIGDTTNCVLTASPAAIADYGDLTGDGIPDLTVVGAQAGLPSGLWLAHGTADGQLNTSITDMGVQGTGANSEGAPSDWDGTQAITGHFNTGAGFNDVLDYNPATGRGTVLYGSGDGSPLLPYSGYEANVISTTFINTTGDKATSIANGGDLYHVLNGEPATGYPDLLVIVGGQLWDEPSLPIPGGFVGIDNALPLTGTNPTGSGDWADWSITSSLVDGLPALFARNTSTGALYYYTPQQLQDLAYGNTVTPLQIASSGYNSATLPVLQAADLNEDGTPDLRTVSSNGKSTTRIFDATAGSLTAKRPQSLVPPATPVCLRGIGPKASRCGNQCAPRCSASSLPPGILPALDGRGFRAVAGRATAR